MTTPPPASCSVRPLVAGDAAIWRDLRLEALDRHPEAFGASHDEWAGVSVAHYARFLDAGCVFGAFVAQSLVGSMALEHDGPSAEIMAVYVKPEHRGRGIAQALMRATRKAAQDRGLDRVHLTVAIANEVAVRFYKSVGFQITGQAPRALARDGRLLDIMTMSMAL